MLYGIVRAPSDEVFGRMVQGVMRAFWPEGQFLDQRHELPRWSEPKPAEERLAATNQSLHRITDGVAGSPDLYQVFDQSGGMRRNLQMPFLNRYYRFFLQREWMYPYRDPVAYAPDLFRLRRPRQEESEEAASRDIIFNYSKHVGDYNHFCNVVMATARFIEYFGDPITVEKVLAKPSGGNVAGQDPSIDSVALRNLAKQLCYEHRPSPRTLRLMIAAFYHDIGKTVDYHRHGMEGAGIVASHSTNSVRTLNEIAGAYGASFDRDDLLFISHLIYYHDQFGVLGTGEAGYLRLVDLVHRLKRYTVTTPREKQAEESRRCLFDLWVLNLADISVSLDGHKNEFQHLWECRHKAATKIEAILYRGTRMAGHAMPLSSVWVHDLRIALRLLEFQNSHHHNDSLARLEEQAMEYARRHVVERIRRLLTALLVTSVGMPADCQKAAKETGPISSGELLCCIAEFTEAKWNSAISRCIYAIGDYTEFARRLAWIGQMDYAFGFFARIATHALEQVDRELRDGAPISGWLFNLGASGAKAAGDVARKAGVSGEADSDQYARQYQIKINAEFFVDNFTSTVIQILHHLLFREKEMDRMRNLEFWVATGRLTPEKLDRIISLEGPYRSHRAVQLALESIFTW